MTHQYTNLNVASTAYPVAESYRFSYQYRPYATDRADYHSSTFAKEKPEINEDSGLATMIASEVVLSRDWDTPEEDDAWADL